MKGSSHRENFILYLQFDRKIDEAFIRLAAYLKEFDLVLVPVAPSEVNTMLGNRGALLICLVDNVVKARKLSRFRKLYLDFALKNGKIGMFLLSSFNYPKKWHIFQRNSRLGFMRLPLRYEAASERIAQFYFDRFFKKQTWPGGRRVKLPLMPGNERNGL